MVEVRSINNYHNGLIFAADVHIGNHKQFAKSVPGLPEINSRCLTTIEAYVHFLKMSERVACRPVVVGDLYDTDKPSPMLYKVLIDSMPTGARPLVIKGNHDSTSTFRHHNALGIAESGIVDTIPTIYRRFDGKIEMWCVPFQAGPAKTWLPEVLDHLAQESKADPLNVDRLLCVHLGIQDDYTSVHMRGHNDSITVSQLKKLASKHKISKIIAGNWHDHKEWRVPIVGNKKGLHIVQLGALVPTGFNNPGKDSYGGMYIHSFNDESYWMELPSIRFVKASSTKNIPKVVGDYVGKCYVQVTVPPSEYNEAMALCNEMKDDGYIIDFKLVTNKKSLEAKSKQSINATKSADTLEKALDNFVKTMPLDSSVDRNSVLNKAKGYL